jgi:ATP-dependent exoDNAse (exonuclease V) beta subunit
MLKAAINSIEDSAERARALDITTSFIVQAPAGSGKTELLIQRFLCLLAHVKQPEEILAITFTKKAAYEMRMRVVHALQQATSNTIPLSAHEQQTWQLAKAVLAVDKKYNWQLISNPNQLRIQTIDALCAYINKQLPLLSAFGAPPEISDNVNLLYSKAIQEVLTHLEEEYPWSQALAELLLHLDNDVGQLHKLLINLLAKRDQWLPYIHMEQDEQAIRKVLEHNIACVIEEHLQALAQLIPQEIAIPLIEVANFCATQLKLQEIVTDISACANLPALPPPTAPHLTAWRGLSQLLFTKSQTLRKRLDAQIGFTALSKIKNVDEKATQQYYREQLSAIIEKLAEHDQQCNAWVEIFYLPDPTYTPSQWKILQNLLTLLKVVAAQLRVVFQQHGCIDFIENMQAALYALGSADEPTDLTLALDYQIRHILIDEFQDTSLPQYQLLEKLIMGWEPHDGRTLFIVGDPMQSIYRFRQAEVGLFLRLWQHGINNIPLTPLVLSVNFRSQQAIVAWNNAHFERIFPAYNDAILGAVVYSKSVAAHVSESRDQQIQVSAFVSSAAPLAEQAIVAKVQSLLETYPDETIAILVRSRSHLSSLLPLLKQAQIDYAAIDIDPLLTRPCIQDLLALTCALLHPADRIAWLSVLRSPCCGLCLADLHILAGADADICLWERLEDVSVIQQLSVDGQARLKRILPILTIKLANRVRENFRIWIESTWVLLGGPASLSKAADLLDIDAYFELLGTLHKPQHLDFASLQEKVARLFAVCKNKQARVQVMTIHSAKGLEFAHVIIPHLNKKLPSDDKDLLLWMERPLRNKQVALLLAPIHATGREGEAIYQYIARQKKIKSDYEIDRLLYVATTRAKKTLHLYFNLEENTNGEYKCEPGSFLAKLWPHLQHKKALLVQSEEGDHQEVKKTPLKLTRLVCDWQNVVYKTLKTESQLHQQSKGFILLDETPRLIGIVTHIVLQQLAIQGLAWWENLSGAVQKQYLTRQLQQQGLVPTRISLAVNMIIKQIENTLSDAKGRWILHPHKEAKAELGLTTFVNGEVKHIVIDRTFIDEEGVRWIIDYKTATLNEQDLQMFIQEEQEKYVQTMQVYAKAMQGLEPERKIKLGLYFPAVSVWYEYLRHP